MNRSTLLLLALLVILAAAAIVSADTWMQPRGDAAATGFQPEDGPAWPDVAIRAELPGSMRAEADMPPLIIEEEILFLARPYDDPDDTDYRVFSVNLETADVTTVAEGIDRAAFLRMTTDGDTVYVSSQRTVHAFPLDPDGHEWTWVGEKQIEGTDQQEWELEWCSRMGLESGNLTLLCNAKRPDQTWCEPLQGTECGTLLGGVLLLRLDAETGQEQWAWTVPRADPEHDHQLEKRSPGSYPLGLAVSGSQVVVLTIEGGCSCAGNSLVDARWDVGDFHTVLWALDAEQEEIDWSNRLQSANWTRATIAGQPVDAEHERVANRGNPAVSDGAVYVKAGQVHKLNLGTGETMWSQPIGEEDVDPDGGRSSAISLGNGHVYTTSAQTLYRIDQDEPEDGWSKSLDFSAQEGFGEQPVVTPSALYTVIASPDAPESVRAFDTRDGSELWRHPGGEQVFSFSVGQGLLAYTQTEFHDEGANTSLVVLGRNDASPTAQPTSSTSYPEAGEQVEVDLSSSQPGVQGPVTRYKAIWGDGATTGWQEDPLLRHTYNQEGEVTARFLAANEANQTSSSTNTFYVGQEAPTEPNMIETAFARENQDMTFGILGIVVAVTGGAIGVARSYRKRTRLQDVLEDIEEAYEETQHNPAECEAQLTERKTHARGLMLDGELREEQLQVVDNRIQELRTQLRMSTLEEGFKDLPHRVVRALEEMLKDGRITRMEHQGAHAAIDEAEGLTDAYKERLREQIDAWHNRDARGHGAR